MRLRSLLATGVSLLALATPATAADELQNAQQTVVDTYRYSIVPPTPVVAQATTVSQAVAKAIPSAYGTVTAEYECSVEAIGDVAFVRLTECSITTNAFATDNNAPPGATINVAATAGQTNLPGRTFYICVQAYVIPLNGGAFYSPRFCGLTV